MPQEVWWLVEKCTLDWILTLNHIQSKWQTIRTISERADSATENKTLFVQSLLMGSYQPLAFFRMNKNTDSQILSMSEYGNLIIIIIIMILN